MKNKRLIILISIFAFLILIVILCSTLFTVKTVSVNWLRRLPEGHLLINKDDEISANVKKGGSIFLFEKDDAIEVLEEKYPYLNVVKIETKFPNKLVLHVADRQELFGIKLNDDCYIILDGTNKVLNKYNALQYSALSVKPICVTIKEQSLNADDFVVGKIANISKVSTVLHSISNALNVLGYEEVDAKGLLNNIEIDLSYNSTITLKTNFANLSIQINKIYSQLNQKIINGLTYYNTAHNEGKSNGVIVVRELTGGSIEGEFVPNI